MRLSDMLQSLETNSLGDDQAGWRQFVLDHLDYIAKMSPVYDVKDRVMNIFAYDLERFLTEQISRQEKIAWIFLLLNNLSSDLVFENPGIYIIPEDRFMRDLYQSYVTTNNVSF